MIPDEDLFHLLRLSYIKWWLYGVFPKVCCFPSTFKISREVYWNNFSSWNCIYFSLFHIFKSKISIVSIQEISFDIDWGIQNKCKGNTCSLFFFLITTAHKKQVNTILLWESHACWNVIMIENNTVIFQKLTTRSALQSICHHHVNNTFNNKSIF